MIARETYMRRIRPFIGSDLIKVITGMRGCGKSVMLELIRKELISAGVDPSRCIAFDFDGMRYAPARLSAAALHEEVLLRTAGIKGKVHLFFDGIEEVTDWEKCISTLRLTLDADIYITGSNAGLLSCELATNLAGRYVEFEIYPFSFAEFCALYSSVIGEEPVEKLFTRYLHTGGMPYLSNIRYEERPGRQYLGDHFRAVLLSDVIQPNGVRDAVLLEEIIRHVMSGTGKTFTGTAIAKCLKSGHRRAAPETVISYLRYCTEAHLLYPVRREDLHTCRILASGEKYYCPDHGIREAVIGGNTKDINLILENIVCMEMLRRGYEVTTGRVGEKEVDFVCRRGDQKLYIQVTYLLAAPETIEREFSVLENINDNFPKYVLSMDPVDMSRNGIRHCNIRDFLLEEWQ